MSPNLVGIEYLNMYGCSCYMEQRKLALARGLDPDRTVHDFMIQRRTIIPVFEDVITMGVNAAKPLLAHVDPNEIGLLIVGTESSPDNGKPISTNIHGALELPPHIRNFETKHACYSGNAALQSAADWVASGASRGKKALVISTDMSRAHLNTKEEFVMGGVAAAAIVSDTPDVFRFDRSASGVWTTHAYDTYRPTSRHEMGNNEVSLYTYLDALGGSYEQYRQQAGDFDFVDYFHAVIFHTPFPGMAMQAHRTLYNFFTSHPKAEVRADFEKRVLPSLLISQSTGSTYGASNLAGLASLFTTTPDIPADARIGLFAYGSGAIGEFYSGFPGERAGERLAEMGLQDHLRSRFEIDVDMYEQWERRREELIDAQKCVIDIDEQSDLYRAQYADQNKYVLTHVDNFQRNYRWS